MAGFDLAVTTVMRIAQLNSSYAKIITPRCSQHSCIETPSALGRCTRFSRSIISRYPNRPLLPILY
jgi:hypothetical protein